MPELLEALAETADPAELLRLTLEDFRAETGTIHLLGADGMLHLKAVVGAMPAPVMNAIRVIPVGKGIAGQAVLQQKPVNICNLQTDSGGVAPPGARGTGAQGSMCVPIMRQGRAVGALGIANYQERAFTDEEIARLLDAGRVIGQKLWNS